MFNTGLSRILCKSLTERYSQIFNLHLTVSSGFRFRCGPKPVAVILCGCGGLDGTELSEAVSLVIHLESQGLKPEFFAPNMDQSEVTDHLSGRAVKSGTPRNVLIESARVARSKIRPLEECGATTGVALFLPGGYGCAKTLSNFATCGAKCVVLPEVQRIVTEFSTSKKPIGAICIAPILVARVLRGTKITLGKRAPSNEWPYAKAIEEAEKMGAKIEERFVNQVTHCKQHNVFSTPAWMFNGTFSDVHDGIGRLVHALKKKIT